MTRESSEGAESGSEPTRLAQFEASIEELEAVVESLEGGEISLEQALSRFERGVTLARDCQRLLRDAELRVDQLLAGDNEDDGERIAEFDAEPSEQPAARPDPTAADAD